MAGTLALAAAVAAPAAGAQTGYTFTTLDVPGALFVSVGGISSTGQIVGSYSPAGSAGERGFVYDAGQFTTITRPGADFTYLYDVNAAGQIVGWDLFETFVYQAGTFTPIAVPGAGFTIATGINDAGQVVGRYGTPGGPFTGFRYEAGAFTPLAVPGATSTTASAISAAGRIVGQFVSATPGSFLQSFLYSGGAFTVLDIPRPLAQVNGVNDAGQVVGSYLGAESRDVGFVYDVGAGTFVEFQVPGARSTYATGIDAAGRIVGHYVDAATQRSRGFVATPTVVPEPATLALTAAGLAAVGAAARRRRA